MKFWKMHSTSAKVAKMGHDIPIPWSLYKRQHQSWLVWLSGLSAGLQTKGSLVQFPVSTQAWVVGQVPSRGRTGGNQTSMFPSVFLSLYLSLKINE